MMDNTAITENQNENLSKQYTSEILSIHLSPREDRS